MSLEAGEAKMYQRLLVTEAVARADGLLLEAEEKGQKEEDMNETGYQLGSSSGHAFVVSNTQVQDGHFSSHAPETLSLCVCVCGHRPTHAQMDVPKYAFLCADVQ